MAVMTERMGDLSLTTDTPQKTMKYEGSISTDGKFHGQGSIVYSNGEKYTGDWAFGQCDAARPSPRLGARRGRSVRSSRPPRRHGRGTYV